MTERTLAAMAVVVVAAGCGGPTDPTSIGESVERQARQVVVTGRLMEYATGLPVPGMHLVFEQRNLSGQVLATAETTSDPTGTYVLTVAPGAWGTQGNDIIATVQVPETGVFHGDLLRDVGFHCVARYGVITDRQTRQPIANVRVRLLSQTVQTDSNGWYRVDFGCSGGPIGFNTTVMFFDAPGYKSSVLTIGRGVFAVERTDLFLGRR